MLSKSILPNFKTTDFKIPMVQQVLPSTVPANPSRQPPKNAHQLLSPQKLATGIRHRTQRIALHKKHRCKTNADWTMLDREAPGSDGDLHGRPVSLLEDHPS